MNNKEKRIRKILKHKKKLKSVHRDIFCFQNNLLVKDVEKVITHINLKNKKNIYDEDLLKFCKKIIGNKNSKNEMHNSKKEIKSLQNKNIDVSKFSAENDLCYEIKIRGYNTNLCGKDLLNEYASYLTLKYYKFLKKRR